MTIVDQGTIYNFFDPIEYNDLEFLGHYIIDGTFNSQNQSDPNLLRLANHKLPILTSLIKDRLGPTIPSKLPCITLLLCSLCQAQCCHNGRKIFMMLHLNFITNYCFLLQCGIGGLGNVPWMSRWKAVADTCFLAKGQQISKQIVKL